MRVIFLMTGNALGGGTLEDFVDMAFLTDHVSMRTGQLEIRQVVVKFGGLPAAGLVTGSAVIAKLAGMNIVLEMADPTFHILGFEIRRHQLVVVAFLANQSLVFAFQLERRPAMIKFFADRFNTIMAAHTVVPIIQGVGIHKRAVHLLVTGLANSLIK